MNYTCTICGLVADVSLFHIRSDGHRPHNCIPCNKKRMLEASRKRYKNHHAHVLAKHREYRLASIEKYRERSRMDWITNLEKRKESKKRRYIKHAEANRAYAKQWRQKNGERDRKSKKEWREKNPHRGSQYMAIRRTRVAKAVPVWADQNRIKEIYLEAKRSGLTVDHIVPLRSKLVCGLHVPDNLSLMTKAENNKKFNSYWPDMPEVNYG